MPPANNMLGQAYQSRSGHDPGSGMTAFGYSVARLIIRKTHLDIDGLPLLLLGSKIVSKKLAKKLLKFLGAWIDNTG
jgi:hypothetical protein